MFSDSKDFRIDIYLKDHSYGAPDNLLRLLFSLISDAAIYTLNDPIIICKFDLLAFRRHCMNNGLKFSFFTFLNLLCSTSRGINTASLYSKIFTNLHTKTDFLRTRSFLYKSDFTESRMEDFKEFDFVPEKDTSAEKKEVKKE